MKTISIIFLICLMNCVFDNESKEPATIPSDTLGQDSLGIDSTQTDSLGQDSTIDTIIVLPTTKIHPGPCNLDNKRFYNDTISSYRFHTYTYDPYGEILTETIDYDNDGTIDWEITYTYDVERKLVNKNTNQGLYTYTYNEQGLLEREEFDESRDTQIDWYKTLKYDSRNNITELTTAYYSMSGWSHKEEVWRYTYNADGSINTMSWSNEGPNTIPRMTWEYTYDANGNLILEEGQLFESGNLDAERKSTYDANGNRLTYSTYSKGSTYQRSLTTNSYNAQNKMLTDYFDKEADGIFDNATNFTWDQFGNILVKEHYKGSADAEGNQIFTLSSREQYIYNCFE